MAEEDAKRRRTAAHGTGVPGDGIGDGGIVPKTFSIQVTVLSGETRELSGLTPDMQVRHLGSLVEEVFGWTHAEVELVLDRRILETGESASAATLSESGVLPGVALTAYRCSPDKAVEALDALAPGMCAKVMSDSLAAQLAGVEAVGNMLLVREESQSRVGLLINAGCLPLLVGFLREGHDLRLRAATCKALCNISCGTPRQRRALVECGTVPLLVEIVGSELGGRLGEPEHDLWDNATLILANLTSDSSELRDLAVGAGAVDAFVQRLQRTKVVGQTFILHAVFNLCRPPSSNRRLLPPLGPPLARCLLSREAWCEFYLSDVYKAVAFLCEDMPREGLAQVASAMSVPMAAGCFAAHMRKAPAEVARAAGGLMAIGDEQRRLLLCGHLQPQWSHGASLLAELLHRLWPVEREDPKSFFGPSRRATKAILVALGSATDTLDVTILDSVLGQGLLCDPLCACLRASDCTWAHWACVRNLITRGSRAHRGAVGRWLRRYGLASHEVWELPEGQVAKQLLDAEDTEDQG